MHLFKTDGVRTGVGEGGLKTGFKHRSSDLFCII